MAHKHLVKAKKAKNDEFYTQYLDIEKEVNTYLDYDEDAFRDKIILSPCDDPECSNFTRFFAQNFEKLGIKKFISTSFSIDPEDKRGKVFVLEKDVTGDGKIDIADLEWSFLNGNGDFNSEEVTLLRDQADIIVTNPPFSLFRDFLGWMLKSNVKFSVIANLNAVTYKEVFPLIKENKMWLGPTIYDGSSEFIVPDTYELTKSGCRIEDGQRYVCVNVRWFTNLDHGKRHLPLSLMTMADNLKFSKHAKVKDIGYLKYDNYNAIEVPFTDAIP